MVCLSASPELVCLHLSKRTEVTLNTSAMAEAEETPAPGSPTLRELVVKVVSACTDRKGLSYYALKMALASEGHDFKLYILKRTVLNSVKRGELILLSNSGLNGRFKAAKPEKGAKKKAAEKKGAKAKKCPEKKERKEPNEPKKPRKPREPREPRNAVVVTLE